MKHTLFRISTLLLALLLLLPLCMSCGKTGTQTQTTPAASATEDPDPDGYKYPKADYNGDVFTIMGCEEKYSMINNVLSDEQTGSAVNDAQYAMTVYLEELLHIDLQEDRAPYNAQIDTLQPIVASNDPHYDLAYLKMGNVGTMFTSDYLMNLYEMPGLELDGAWWNQNIKEESSLLGDRLYFLVSDANLMSFDGTWCVYFNKRMFEDRNLPFPYQTVKDGKWTLDELYRIAHTYAEVNGEANATAFHPGGTAIYGLASQVNLMSALLTGCNEVYCKLDADKKPYFALAESTTLADAADKIIRLVGSTQDCTFINTNSTGVSYIADVFMQERSLLMGGEVNNSRTMNEMKSPYGVLPIPKATEDQEDYKSHMLTEAMYLTVPTSCSDYERASVVMDSLSYYANKNILPKYFNSVCYRGLSDQDSIDMLEIIHRTQYLNWAMAYGWVEGAVAEVVNILNYAQTGLVAKVQSLKRGVNAMIERTMNSLE